MGKPTVRVLLIEDDRDDYVLTRDLLADILGNHYHLDWAPNYDSGLEALARCEHDVCLLDYRLGARNGLDLLREATARGCKAATIVLTGQKDQELDLAAMEAGATDFLEKSRLTAAVLERALRYALEQKRLSDELEQRVAERTAELRESEERYRTLFESVPVAVFVCDRQAVIQYYNRRAVELWGREPVCGVEQHCGSLKLYLPDGALLPHAQSPMMEVLRTGIPAKHVEVFIERPNGSRIAVMVNFAALNDARGNITGAVTSFEDITDRKRAEDALREADRHKDEFLATLAHELRGPLAPLRNMLEIMKRTDDDGSLLQQARDTMERQLGQMVRLVDDLLDVGRISRGKIELKRERVELASVVSQSVEACRPLAESARHEVHVTLPPEPIHLHADPVRLTQIFSNLLNNSCKYSEPGSKIWLTAERQGSDVVVKVKDTGIGIPADKLASVFEMFAQVQSALERSQGGLGIGLMLVRRLVEMHGGIVEAFSEGPGRGSEFVVRLPILLEKPKVQGPPQQTGKQHRTPGRRILIVDDNRDGASSLAMLLKITGNATQTAHDGLEAVEAAERFRPEVVLLDIGLPKLNGYDACRRIREQAWGKNMVLVAVTGWGQDEDRRKSQEAGFDHHMVKPVDYDALMKLLAQLQPTPV